MPPRSTSLLLLAVLAVACCCSTLTLADRPLRATLRGATHSASAGAATAHVTHAAAAAASLSSPRTVGSPFNIPWSTLTAAQLSLLNTTVIASANSTDIASLPASACAGWSATQLGALGSTTPWTACTGLSIGCMAQISSDAVAGFIWQCIDTLLPPVFASLNASRISQLSDYALMMCTDVQVVTMGLNCAGLRAEQLAPMGGTGTNDACAQIQPLCMKHLSPAAIGGFGGGGLCAPDLTAAALGVLTAIQFAQMPPDALADFTASPQLAAIPTAAWAGATSDQLQSLSTVYPTQCGVITPASWAIMNASAYQGLTTICVGEMDPAGFALSLIDAAQLHQIPALSFSGLSQIGLAHLNPPSCAGFQAKQLPNLHELTCIAFSPECVANIPPQAMSGFSQECLSQLSTTAVAVLSAQQLAGLGPYSCSGFSQSQIEALDATACAGISPVCIGNLESAAAAGFSSECISFLSTNSTDKFTSNQLTALTVDAVSGFSAAQLLSLYRGVPAVPMPAPSLAFVDSWNSAQGNALSLETMTAWIADMDTGVIANTSIQPWNAPDLDITSKSQLQLSACGLQCIPLLFASANAPNQLPFMSWGGLRAVQVQAIGVAALPWLTNMGAYLYWPTSALAALSGAQVASIPAASFSNISIWALSAQGLSGLSVADINQTREADWSQVTCSNTLAANQLAALVAVWPQAAQQLQIRCGLIKLSSSTGAAAAGSSAGAASSTASPLSSSAAPVPAASSSAAPVVLSSSAASFSSSGAAVASSSAAAQSSSASPPTASPSPSASSSTGAAPSTPSSSGAGGSASPIVVASSTGLAPRPSSSTGAASAAGGDDGSKGMSTGTKAAIAIGVIVGLIALGALVYAWRRSRARHFRRMTGLDQAFIQNL